jgi:TRAP transporter TAXI family solute receptor
MKTTIQILVMGLIVVAFYGMTSVHSMAAEQKTIYINFGTAGMGGPSYILGAGWAKIVSDNVPWLKATAVPGGGAFDNMKKVLRGELLTATVPADSAYNMYHGLGLYKEKMPIRAMFEYAPAHVYLCTRAESKIKSYEDLKGHRVGMGAPGSGLAGTTTTIMESMGLQPDRDYKAIWYGYQDVVNGLKDKTIDAGFLYGGHPNPAVMELATSIAIRIIPAPKELPEKFKYMVPVVIKTGSYKGINEDVPIVSIDILVCTAEQANEKIVYTVTKTLMEHYEEVRKLHSSAKEFGLGTALRGVAIPLHRGAEKYYKEVGLIK